MKFEKNNSPVIAVVTEDRFPFYVCIRHGRSFEDVAHVQLAFTSYEHKDKQG